MGEYKEIAAKLKEADAILIGASNGFSISEGLHIFAGNQAFEEVFGDFKGAGRKHWADQSDSGKRKADPGGNFPLDQPF